MGPGLFSLRIRVVIKTSFQISDQKPLRYWANLSRRNSGKCWSKLLTHNCPRYFRVFKLLRNPVFHCRFYGAPQVSHQKAWRFEMGWGKTSELNRMAIQVKIYGGCFGKICKSGWNIYLPTRLSSGYFKQLRYFPIQLFCLQPTNQNGRKFFHLWSNTKRWKNYAVLDIWKQLKFFKSSLKRAC